MHAIGSGPIWRYVVRIISIAATILSAVWSYVGEGFEPVVVSLAGRGSQFVISSRLATRLWTSRDPELSFT